MRHPAHAQEIVVAFDDQQTIHGGFHRHAVNALLGLIHGQLGVVALLSRTASCA